MSNAEQVAYWITEREKIRVKKETGVPPPWTKDPILRRYRFCNVHREDDKVTRWIAHNWRNPHVASPLFVAAVVLARMVNWPATLAKIGFPEPWNTESIVSAIQTQELMGKAWSSAYIVSTNGISINKALYVVRDVCYPVAKAWHGHPASNTLAAYYDKLRGFNGLGSFMAGQIIADLKNTPGHPLTTASDWWTWATHGPGSLRGLTAYYGEHISKEDFKRALDQMIGEVGPRIKRRLHAQDWQNVMCEYSKYVKTKEGYGRPKANYAPTANFPDIV